MTDELLYAEDATSILAETGKRTGKVFVPGQNRWYRIRSIASYEITDINKEIRRETGGKKDVPIGETTFRERVVMRGCIKESGDQVFSHEHLKSLKQWPAGDIGSLVKGILKLSGIGEEAIEEAEADLENDPLASSA